MKKLFWIIFLLATPGWANTYYVSSGANSTNCSSATNSSTPVGPNIQRGLACLASGDVLTVKAGTYSTTSDTIDSSAFPGGPNSSTPTIIQCEGFRTCTLSPSGNGESAHFANISNVTLRNFRFDATVNLQRQAVHIDQVANNILIDGNEVVWNPCSIVPGTIDPGNAMFDGELDSEATATRGNRIMNNYVHGVNCTPTPRGTAYGCYCSDFGLIIDGNTYENTQGFAIQWQSHSGQGWNNGTIRNNLFINNSVDMILYGSNHLVYNNISTGASGTSIDLHDFNSVDGNNILVANNTFYNSSASSDRNAVIFSAGSNGPNGGNKIRNNIIFPAGSSNAINDIGSGSSYSNNLCPSGLSSSLGCSSPTSTPGNEFVNTTPPIPPATDATFLALKSTATAIGYGGNLTGTLCSSPCSDKAGVARPSNGAWDDGAYQFGVVIPPPPDTPPLEDFVYTTSTNLSGQNCTNGTIHCNNWTGPWVDSGGASVFTVEVAPSGSFSGGNAATSTGSGTSGVSRTFTPVGTGSVIWQMRSTVNNDGYRDVSLADTSGAHAAIVAMKNDGHFHACADYMNDTDLGAYSTNTFYLLEANFDSSGHANQYRVRINEGAFSGWINFCQPTSSSQVNTVVLFDNTPSSHTYSIDTIGAKSTSVAFTTQPVGPYNSGATFTVAAGIVYSDGVTVHSSDTTSISMALCAGGPAGTFGGTTPKSPVSGISTFNDLSITAVNGGTGYTLCASGSGLLSGTSNSFNITGVNQSPGIPGKRARIRARIK